jgi:hypothetical protein
MVRIAGEQPLQHFVDAPDVRRIEILQPRATAGRRARPRDEMKQRVGVQRAHIQIVRIGFDDLFHGPRVRRSWSPRAEGSKRSMYRWAIASMSARSHGEALSLSASAFWIAAKANGESAGPIT